MRRTAPVVLLIALLAGGPAGAEWQVKPTGRAGSPGCSLISEPQPMWDGYQNATAHLVVNGSTLVVRSASVLDGSGTEIGMQVDTKPFVPMDRLGDTRTASFDASHGVLVEQFKAGRQVRVQLKFWPTWPATGTHPATFSLLGFTKAYAEMLACR